MPSAIKSGTAVQAVVRERKNMKTKIITKGEIDPLKISTLPTRPTAPTAYGGSGYTAEQMKAAFDRLPELIAERLNTLIVDVCDGEILDAIPTGIESAATVKELIAAITNGTLAGVMRVMGVSLASYLTSLREDVDALAERIGGGEA